MKSICVLFFFCVVSLASPAQILPFRHFTTNQGLPHANVFCIEQDVRGFIWIGTENGVACFDGKDFTAFSPQYGLSGNEATAMAKTPGGKRIWVGLYDGKIQYTENGSVHDFPVDRNIVSVFPNLMEQQGVLYSALMKTVFTLKGNNLKKYYTPAAIGSIHDLCGLAADSVLLGTDKGCFIFRNGHCSQRLKTSGVHCFNKDARKQIWAGTKGKILLIDKTCSRVLKSIPVDTAYVVKHILSDSKGRIWYTCVSGFGRNKFIMLHNGKTYPVGEHTGIDGLQVNYLFEDAQQNIWICTYGKGIYCLYNTSISNYTTTQGLSNNYVFSILKMQNGQLLAGSYSGINIVEAGLKLNKTLSDKFPARLYKELHLAANGDVFASGSDYPPGLVHSNAFGQLRIHYCNTKSIYLSGDTLLMGGWDNAVEYYLKKQNNYVLVKKQKIPARIKGYVRINSLLKDTAGVLWVGSSRGLFCLRGNEKMQETMAGIFVNEISTDTYGRIWVAHEGGILYNDKSGWKNFERNGEFFRATNTIAFDTLNNIWIGTSHGIYVATPQKIRHIDHNNGLLSDNINKLYYDTLASRLWVASGEGLSCLNIIEFLDDQVPQYPIRVQKIVYGNTQQASLNELVRIPYGQRDIRIYFSQPEFRNPDGISYHYWFSDNPHEKYTTRSQYIQFASVEPGHYTLCISGSEHPADFASVEFEVEKPLWLEWPFIATAICCTIMIITWFTRQKIQKVKKQEEQKRAVTDEMSRLRYQAIVSTMNPHFIFNSLNTVQSFVNENRVFEANEYIAGFGRLLRLNLDVVHRSSITLEEELQRLDQYLFLEKIRFGTRLNYEISVHPSIAQSQLLVPNMLLQPFAENAIKHGILPSGRDGLLSINITQHTDDICFVIEDNGIGINAARLKKKSHISQGIRLVEERLKLLPGNKYSPVVIEEITRPDGSCAGTRVVLRISTLLSKL